MPEYYKDTFLHLLVLWVDRTLIEGWIYLSLPENDFFLLFSVNEMCRK